MPQQEIRALLRPTRLHLRVDKPQAKRTSRVLKSLTRGRPSSYHAYRVFLSYNLFAPEHKLESKHKRKGTCRSSQCFFFFLAARLQKATVCCTAECLQLCLMCVYTCVCCAFPDNKFAQQYQGDSITPALLDHLTRPPPPPP